MTTTPIIELDRLSVSFGFGATRTQALDEVSFSLLENQVVGLVGESGSGKSTLAKAIVGLVKPTSGHIRFQGKDVTALSRGERRSIRRAVQLIPQDPYSSLDPRHTIGYTLAEAISPAAVRPKRYREEVERWLEVVRLDADVADRYPHEFSGGQRQRIAIARALAVKPSLIIADEITSALDVSVQAEVLNLLAQLRTELDFTMIFISHNLAVVRHVSDLVAVLFHGELVEHGDAAQIFENPHDPYTKRLVDSVPGGPSFDLG